jgi:hypothetical protein
MFLFRGDSKQCSQYPSDSAPKQLFDANQSTPDKCQSDKSANWLHSHILGFRHKEPPNPANQPSIPEQQSHDDCE